MPYSIIKKSDPEIFEFLLKENDRQENNLEMIASENFVSQAVLQAYTSTLTNKYAEGYPRKRYYGGCEFADEIEETAIHRVKKLFSCEYANVQPHSGAQANMAVFFTILNPGDTFLGMDLSHGGHLTHGLKVNFSGLHYNAIHYGVRKEDHRIDYDQLEKLALEYKPKLIIAGASAYPREIQFDRFAEIAQKVNACLMVDIAHIAGLIATGLHPSPLDYNTIVTSTTHKTLRGPRGGLLLSNQPELYGKKLNSRLFPGVQGGPLMHVIAAKAVAFKEALSSNFVSYQKNIIHNAKILSEKLVQRGFKLVSGGTDNHLVLMDVFQSKKITGKEAESILENAGLTVNKNTVPFDQNPPAIASGIRLGTPALTTRGFQEQEFKRIGDWIADLLENPEDEKKRDRIKMEIEELCRSFPMDKFRLP